MTRPDDPSSHRTRQRIVLRLAELGIPTTDAEAQRHVCAVWTKGAARRRSEMTEREAGALAARLDEMTREQLAEVLARPVPEWVEPLPHEVCPEYGAATCRARPGRCCMEAPGKVGPPPTPELPAGAIVCGPGPVSEHDAEQVRAFAAALDSGPAAVAAFALGKPEPEPGPEPVEEPTAEPVAVVEEPPAPVRRASAPGRYCLPEGTCYCGECPHWTPIPLPDYSKTPGSIAYEEAQRWRR